MSDDQDKQVQNTQEKDSKPADSTSKTTSKTQEETVSKTTDTTKSALNKMESNQSKQSKSSSTLLNKSKPKKIGLKLIALLILVLLLVGVGYYKFYEWQTLKILSDQHAAFISAELQQQQKVNKLAEELDLEYADQEEQEEEEEVNYNQLDPQEVIQETEELMGDYKVFEDNAQTYLQLVEDHQGWYQQFRSNRSRWVVGGQAEFIDSFVDNQNRFYQAEINDSRRNLARLKYYKQLMQTSRDGAMLNIYSARTNDLEDEQAIGEEFGLLSNLETYNQSDFEIEGEDMIEEYLPYGLEVLEKQVTFLGGMYDAIKELVAENYQSAGYKFSRMGDEIAAVQSIDFDRVDDESENDSEPDKKELVESLLERYQLIQDFTQNKSHQYPGLESLDQWQTPLVACQVYMYKTDLYQVKKDEYPQVNGLTDLEKELDKLSPSTGWVLEMPQAEQIDYQFNQDDERAVITCGDAQDETFRFSYDAKDQLEQDEDETENDSAE